MTHLQVYFIKKDKYLCQIGGGAFYKYIPCVKSDTAMIAVDNWRQRKNHSIAVRYNGINRTVFNNV